MRVTGNTFTTNFLNQVTRLTARQQQLQTQAATGQRVTAPEDDPAAMQRVLALRAEQLGLTQFRTNVSILQDRATNAFNALKGIKSLSDRAGEIATLADGTRSQEELKTYASEVTQMIKQAVHTMNSKYGNQFLFAGTASDQPPFTIETDADGFVTSVTYNGNTNVTENEISDGSSLTIDVPGANTTGTGARGVITDSRSGADFFNHLISLQNNLRDGNISAIASVDRPALAKDEENLIYHIGNNGVTQSRLETAKSALLSRTDSLEKMISKQADADLTETLVKLTQSQTAFQAALQSGATLMRLSLMNYLS